MDKNLKQKNNALFIALLGLAALFFMTTIIKFHA